MGAMEVISSEIWHAHSFLKQIFLTCVIQANKQKWCFLELLLILCYFFPPVYRAEWYVAHGAKAGVRAVTECSHWSDCDSGTSTADTGAQIFSHCAQTHHYIAFGRWGNQSQFVLIDTTDSAEMFVIN